MGSTIALAQAASIESAYLPANWEIKVISGSEDPDGPAPAAQLIAADESTGEVTAIVGITNVVDHVGDVIMPGAYTKTLSKRRPKVCWAHSWEVPIGKVLRIEEWSPGDPRFAKVGATLDGKAWPAEAGALVAHMQMNLKSDKGREAFAAVQFYSETGECEWSIGWQPIPAKTLRRKDGVRECKEVELYEVSPVLFGAAPLTRTLQVKSLNLNDATQQGLRNAGRPVVGGGGVPEQGAALNTAAPQPGEADPVDEATLHRNAMDEIDWAEVDQAAATSDAPPAPGTPATAAGSGATQDPAAAEDAADGGSDDATEGPDGSQDPAAAEDAADGGADDAEEGPDGSKDPAAAEDAADGGADDAEENPDGSKKKKLAGGAPPFVKKKSGGGVLLDAKSLAQFTDTLDLAALGVLLPEVKAEGGADQNRGGAEQLRRWYVHGEGASRIAWGSPGDFSRCVAIAGPHMGERANGYCQLRHKDALGIYTATHAAQEHAGVAGKAYAAASTLAKSWNPLLEVGVHAAHDNQARKFMAEGVDGLRGSFEQRQEKLRRGIDPVLKDAIGWTPVDRSKYRGDEAMPGDDCWTSIDGTWNDRVVATIVRYGEERSKQTFVVPYSFDGDEVSFGKPQPVELQVSIVPSPAGKPSKNADDLFAGVVEEDQGLDDPDGDEDDMGDAIMLPAISLLGSGIGAMKSALVRAPETKAGRVLSEANASRLRGALEHLLEVARSAGIDLPGWTGPEESPADDGQLPDTTAVPAGAAAPMAGRGAPTAVKVLSLAEVQADLAGLQTVTAADVQAEIAALQNFLS